MVYSKSVSQNIGSIIFIVFFIGGQTLAAVLPFEYQKTFLYTAFFVFIVIAMRMIRLKIIYYSKPVILFSLSFIVTGTLNIFVHDNSNLFVLVAPFGSFFGFYYLLKNKIRLFWIDISFILLYLFFYNEYFSILPDLFYRPGFDEDGVVFDMSSSNAIPISLNLTLYAYLILNKLYAQNNISKIFIFAVINSILALIQQSRTGIFIALILLVMVSYEYNKKTLKWLLILFIPVLVGSIQTIINTIIDLQDVIGNITELEGFEEEVRGQGQIEFFQNMDFITFLFGHTSKSYSVEGNVYTFNVFLDMWDRYGLTQLVIFLGALASRFFKREKFLFPIYYFIPFIIYSFAESIFFPNYGDVIIYIILFIPRSYNE